MLQIYHPGSQISFFVKQIVWSLCSCWELVHMMQLRPLRIQSLWRHDRKHYVLKQWKVLPYRRLYLKALLLLARGSDNWWSIGSNIGEPSPNFTSNGSFNLTNVYTTIRSLFYQEYKHSEFGKISQLLSKKEGIRDWIDHSNSLNSLRFKGKLK